jgi:hypothetical protein
MNLRNNTKETFGEKVNGTCVCVCVCMCVFKNYTENEFRRG